MSRVRATKRLKQAYGSVLCVMSIWQKGKIDEEQELLAVVASPLTRNPAASNLRPSIHISTQLKSMTCMAEDGSSNDAHAEYGKSMVIDTSIGAVVSECKP